MHRTKLLFFILYLFSIQLAFSQNNNPTVSLQELQEIELTVKQTSKEIKSSTKKLNEVGDKIENIKNNKQQKSKSFLDVKLYDDDFIKLAFRFLLNLLAIVLIARAIYYPLAKRKDYLFTYIMISILVFFICFTLKKFELGLGMALGLFAIFGIIRYRTDPIPIKEMTYLFIVITIGVINGISLNEVSHLELIFTNTMLVLMTYILENYWQNNLLARRTIEYDVLENIKPENHKNLLLDLEERTGLSIQYFKIRRVYLDRVNISIYFKN